MTFEPKIFEVKVQGLHDSADAEDVTDDEILHKLKVTYIATFTFI